MSPEAETGILNKSGMNHCKNGDLDNAQGMLFRALDRAKASGSTTLEAQVRSNLAMVLHLGGCTEAAQLQFRQAKSLAMIHGDKAGNLYRRIEDNQRWIQESGNIQEKPS